MKPYLVDVPVLYHVWCRPEVQRQTFERIREARPSVLFLSSDAGRNEEEWAKIRQSREIVENIDWDCKVYKLYYDTNQGMYATARQARAAIFAEYDRFIDMEDDVLADPSFFRYCAELLERYKDDERIHSILGENPLGKWEKPNSDYFFCHGFASWGYASWKRSWDPMYDRAWMDDPYLIEVLTQHVTPNFAKNIADVKATGMYDGHPAGSEFFFEVDNWLQTRLCIFPKYNLCRNIGATDDATHAVDLKKLDHWTQRKFTTPVYSLTFPMKHAKYVIEDLGFRNELRKTAAGSWRYYVGRGITIGKRLYYGDAPILWQKFVKRVIKREKEIET